MTGAVECFTVLRRHGRATTGFLETPILADLSNSLEALTLNDSMTRCRARSPGVVDAQGFFEK
jgi:hypothetical protein